MKWPLPQHSALQFIPRLLLRPRTWLKTFISLHGIF